MTGEEAPRGPLALIGGTGALPAALVATLEAQDRPVVLCELAGFAFAGLDGRDRMSFRLETISEFLASLHDLNVRNVCFAGAIRRPAVDPAAITPASAPLVARLAQAMQLGDDGALRAVIALFEAAGFAVTGAADIAPGLLPIGGVLGRVPVPQGFGRDLVSARTGHAQMAQRDEGQAVVVRGGRVLVTEGPAGTDAMLGLLTPAGRSVGTDDPLEWAAQTDWTTTGAVADRLAGAAADLPPPEGGILFKAPKAGQDRRVDLPVIGPGTVIGAAAAGLRAIAIEAGGVMVLDLAQTVALADGIGVCIAVVPTSGATV